jgi:A/G-specific adenine glycosylase
MDLGASLCSLRRPACESCPLAGLCVARAEGRPEAYPVKTRKLKRGTREHVLLWLAQGDALWLVQRPQTGVWAGLWSLPEFNSDEALWALAAGWPDTVGEGRPLPTVQHTLTHFDWTLRPVFWPLPDRLAATQRQVVEASLPPGRWVARDAALGMGLPAPIRRLLEAGVPPL